MDVTDSASVTNEDGMIGSDVFSSYLIDIDIPDLKLRLTPLPKRSEGGNAPATLKTQDESESAAEGSEREGAGSKPSGEASAQSTAAPASEHKPMDRYVAPEMASWTPVFRFGHNLMIPTHVNDSPHMLFLIDTGSMMTMLSKRTAKTYTKLSADPDTEVHGMSGAVERVYRARRSR